MRNWKLPGSTTRLLRWSSWGNALFALLVFSPIVGIWATGQFHSVLGGVIAGVLYAGLMLNGALLQIFSLWMVDGRIDAQRMALLYARVNLYHAVLAAIAAAISLIAWFPVLLVFSLLGIVGTVPTSLIYYYAYLRISRHEAKRSFVQTKDSDRIDY